MADDIKKNRGRPRKKTIDEMAGPVNDKGTDRLLMNNNSTEDSGNKITYEHVTGALHDLYDQITKTGSLLNISDMNLNNPFLQNNRLKTISAYPSNYSPDQIADALREPQNHEMMLQGASASLSSSQYLYYKILREAADTPLFKHYFVPPLLEKESDYSSSDFVKEEEFVEDWVKSFKLVQTLKKMSMEVKREGKPTYVYRQRIVEENGKKHTDYAVFQKLPPAYVKLTGIGEYGYVASFNMMIFMRPAFSPKQYPEYIQTIWNNLIGTKTVYRNQRGDKYCVDLNKLRNFSYTYNGENFSGNLEINASVRRSSEDAYVYWVRLPSELAFTFASDMSNAWAVPDTSGLFTALQELTDYSTLAGLIASTPLTAVLTGEVEFVDGAKPGQDETKIAPHSLDAFQNIFNNMASTNISSYFAPFKNLKLQSLPNIPNSSDIKTKAVQNFISVAGEGGLITASDKPSVAAIKGSQLSIESQYEFVTKQFEDVLNFLLNKFCGLKYKWDLKIWGGIYTIDNRIKTMKEMLAAGATFMLPRLASAYDMTMRDVRATSSYIENSKIYDKFKTLSWKQQEERAKASEDQSKVGAGRKTIDDSDIDNDSTAQSKETGANISELKTDYSSRFCPLCGNDVEEGHIFCSECENEYNMEGQDE